MDKRNIDGEKQRLKPKVPGREEFAPDFSTYAEKREAMKELYRSSQKRQQESE